jgi:hypothetical protein
MSSTNEGGEHESSMERLFAEGDWSAQVDFNLPLVNHHSQEYHAPSVFTSHGADI